MVAVPSVCFALFLLHNDLNHAVTLIRVHVVGVLYIINTEPDLVRYQFSRVYETDFFHANHLSDRIGWSVCSCYLRWDDSGCLTHPRGVIELS